MEVESPSWQRYAGIGMQLHNTYWRHSPRSSSAKVGVRTRPRSSAETWQKHGLGVFPKSPSPQTAADGFSDYGDSSGLCTPSSGLANAGGCCDLDTSPWSDRTAAGSGSSTPRPQATSPVPSVMLSFSHLPSSQSKRRPASVTAGQLTRRRAFVERPAIQLGDVVREASNVVGGITKDGPAVMSGHRRPYTAPERVSRIEPSLFRPDEYSSVQVLPSSVGTVGGGGGASGGRLQHWDSMDGQPQRILSASIDWRGAVTPPSTSNAVVKRIFKGHSYLKRTRLSIDSKESLLAGREATNPTQMYVTEDCLPTEKRTATHIEKAHVTRPTAGDARVATHGRPGAANAAHLSGRTGVEGLGQAKSHAAESSVPCDPGYGAKQVRSRKGVSFHKEESIYCYEGKPKFKAAKEYISFVESLTRADAQSPSIQSGPLIKQPVIVVCGVADDRPVHSPSSSGSPADQESADDRRLAKAPVHPLLPVPNSEVDRTASALHLTVAGLSDAYVTSDEPKLPLELQMVPVSSRACAGDPSNMAPTPDEYELKPGSANSDNLAEDEAYDYYPEEAVPVFYTGRGSPAMLVQPPRTPPSIRPPYTMPEDIAGYDLTVESCSRAPSSALAYTVAHGSVNAKIYESRLTSAPTDPSCNSDGIVGRHGWRTVFGPMPLSASSSPIKRCTRDSQQGCAAAALPSCGRPIPDIVEAEDWQKTASDCERLRLAKAAVDIQRIFRGYVARAVYRKLQHEHREKMEDRRMAAIEIQRCYRRHLSRKKNIYRSPPREHARSAAWSRAYADIRASEEMRRQLAAKEVLDRNAKEKVQLRQKIAVIGPHVEVYKIFHPPRDGPTLKQMNHAATIIQKHFRGWLIRKKLANLKVKVALQFPSWVKFAKYYRTYLSKLVRYTGVEKPRVTVDINQMDKFVVQKKRFESVFDKRSFGNELDEDELEQYFKECDLYPGEHEVEHALDLVLRGKVKKRKKTLTKQEVLDITFHIYMPEGTGLANNRKSTWLHPIVDGEDALKLTDSTLIEPTPLGPCLRLVQESRRERRAQAVLDGGQLALGKSS